MVKEPGSIGQFENVPPQTAILLFEATLNANAVSSFTVEKLLLHETVYRLGLSRAGGAIGETGFIGLTWYATPRAKLLVARKAYFAAFRSQSANFTVTCCISASSSALSKPRLLSSCMIPRAC